MWWRKRQLAGTQKFESFRRVLRRSYLWRSFGSLEGLSGLPSNNQGGIQVPWWCNTQLNSIVKFRNENYKRHINSNWRNDGFVLGLLEGPPLQIRNYVVIIRSSDAICEIWLVQKTIAFVHYEWTFSGRFSFDFRKNLHIRATTHIQTRHQMFNKLHHVENWSYSAEDITLLWFLANV